MYCLLEFHVQLMSCNVILVDIKEPSSIFTAASVNNTFTDNSRLTL